MTENGLIQLYYGDGKGKTTAALGLALRAVGSGQNVMLVQFLKTRETGELTALAIIPCLTVVCGSQNRKFSFQMDEAERKAEFAFQTECLRETSGTARFGKYDMMILDEALSALSVGLLDEQLLRKVVLEKPSYMEMVLTGRNPPDWLLEAADYASEIQKRKHPFDRGIGARSGIEF